MGNTQIANSQHCLRSITNKLFKTKFLRLIAAIKVGNLTHVRYYFANKVNFNQYLPNGDTPLHVAIRCNKVDIAKFIADNVPNLNLNDKNFVGDTPLLLAIMNGNAQLVEYLVLRKYVDVDIAENRGFTPFIAACANGSLKLVRFLVKQGCNYRIKAKDGQTGLHRAAFYGNFDVVRYLIKELKMNVMLPDKKGNLPLHLACMKVNINSVRILIRASPVQPTDLLHMPNKYGVTPLDILVRVLNRVKKVEEPHEFEAEEIEEYIKDKQNVPFYKKVLSPTSKSILRVGTLFDRSDTKIKVKHDSPQKEKPILHLRSSVNDHTFSDKAINTTDPLLATEDKAKQTEEDDLLKIRAIETSEVLPSPIPLLELKNSPSEPFDLSPLNLKSKVSSPKTVKSRTVTKKFLRINTKSFTQSIRAATLRQKTTPNLHLHADDGKSANSNFAPVVKSKFAVQSSTGKVEEEAEKSKTVIPKFLKFFDD